jgi:spermidine/putrescine transport system permease protein
VSVEQKAESKRRRKTPEWLAGNILLAPTSVWFIFLLVIPTLLIMAYALGQRGVFEPIRFSWGKLVWSNYSKALNPDFLPIFIRSIVYAFVATVFCVVLGFPLAYWIARFGGRFRNVFLVLVIIPFLTSYLIRTYGFLPFMILPLYASIERMDKSLVEASYDLGHGKTSTLFRVIVPTVAPGLIAGVLLVFIPAVGDYITPALLGGVRTQMIGTTIADQFGSGNNWPLGSAMSVLLMAFILVGVFVYLRRVGEEAL